MQSCACNGIRYFQAGVNFGPFKFLGSRKTFTHFNSFFRNAHYRCSHCFDYFFVMAATNGKRKREEEVEHHPPKKSASSANVHGNGKTNFHGQEPDLEGRISIQIVTGSYEKVLHGIHASIPKNLIKQSEPSEIKHETVKFSDTFLFAPHTASIRCLAVSPATESGKRTLATGGSDERINLYSLSTAPPAKKLKPNLPTLEGSTTAENSRNRSLGNLIHHDRPITRLSFPTKSKLFSSAEDNNIAITRTKDWTVLSSIKAPIPKPQGRPSGDTAEPGEVPAGVNDFAIHPSQKLMLSVGRGEKCMRLWNLMTGKKAGVLNFDRELLAQVGEGRFSSSEGRRVLWSESGESFVVALERGAVLFGIDSTPKAIIKPSRPTKLHQIRFLPTMLESGVEDVLAVSSEDGRIIFYDARIPNDPIDIQSFPSCETLAELGGAGAGISGRIKDFEVLPLNTEISGGATSLLIVTASSDGAIRIWAVAAVDIIAPIHPELVGQVMWDPKANGSQEDSRRVGSLIGTLETGNRITCLGAFVMSAITKEAENAADVAELEIGDDDGESDSDSEGTDDD